ncbi:hypothetical protein CUROG_04715 [Corynebacterium urogenitale]|uniref:Uncharacterized protein n=1 Tax=Corynebacterium urogenitale TaxID=2487892 RepID=A0A5J6Z9T9_9CORY|nr:hypothetical protein [Corynebacterium urogenitale]QFQ02317.1 hypothetical protein CUROG_04715 [Corynebacterium urogenitale]
MSPQAIFYSRIMRVVVLAFFIGFLLLNGTNWVNLLFSAVCAIFLLVTLWQLWTTFKRDGGLP